MSLTAHTPVHTTAPLSRFACWNNRRSRQCPGAHLPTRRRIRRKAVELQRNCLASKRKSVSHNAPMPFIREREHAHACPRMPTHAHMSLPASAVFLNPLWCRSAECTARGAPLSPWRTDEWHNTAVLPPLPGHVLRRPLDHVPAACAQIHTLVFFRTHTHTHTHSLSFCCCSFAFANSLFFSVSTPLAGFVLNSSTASAPQWMRRAHFIITTSCSVQSLKSQSTNLHKHNHTRTRERRAVAQHPALGWEWH